MSPGESCGWGPHHCQREVTKVGKEQEGNTNFTLLPALSLQPRIPPGSLEKYVL